MALTRTDCLAAAAALLFLGLLGGESALADRDENPFIDSNANEAYFAWAYAGLHERTTPRRETAARRADTDLEYR